MRLYFLPMLFAFATLAQPAKGEVDYNRQIKPLLATRCAPCHGALEQKGKLRLDHGELIRKGGRNGVVVKPGNSGQSPLVQAILGQDRPRMPPPKDGAQLTTEQIILLKQWIDEGARSPTGEIVPPTPSQHWAFIPPARKQVPPKGANPIDAFLEKELGKQGLTGSRMADKPVLLRRLYLDLVGLPPSPEAIRRFQQNTSVDAYEKVVETLLNDPRHGERWARHWMDIWRYADWHGRRPLEDVWNSAPQVWRWRDWIVNSLNHNQGYDSMLRAMLAADEIEPGNDEAVVATGFLVRNWYALNGNDWMRSIVEHTGKAFLGLTFNCAHCHDHKYDPIKQEDYFGFRAFFEPIRVRQVQVPGQPDPGPYQEYNYLGTRKVQRLGMVSVFDHDAKAPTWFYTGGDERNRVKERGSIPPRVPAFFNQTPPTIAPLEMPGEWINPALRPEVQASLLADARATLAQGESELAKLSGQSEKDTKEKSAEALRHHWAKKKVASGKAALEDVQARLQAETAVYSRPPAANLAELKREASRKEKLAQIAKAESNIAEAEWAIADTLKLDEAKRKAGQDAANKKITQEKTALQKAQAALKDPAQQEKYSPFTQQYPPISTGRRKALAFWITSKDNPLTARVAVNHIWNWHFHAPLVPTVYDFGRNGKPPSHPELLDWLTVEFMESGWNLKHLHRLIVTSKAYQRSTTGNEVKDPENLWLSRMNTGRMEAEVLRDTLLTCAGKLDSTMKGQELEITEYLKSNRRTLYYSCYPELGGRGVLGELFDGPDPNDCYRRSNSIIPQQALILANSDLVHQLSGELAKKLQEESLRDGADFIPLAFERVLSRPPTSQELQACQEFLGSIADDKARAGLVRALFNHNDFLAIR